MQELLSENSQDCFDAEIGKHIPEGQQQFDLTENVFFDFDLNGFTQSSFQPFTETIFNIDFEMIPVKGGVFSMGDMDDECGDSPVHSVKINDFYISKNVVTVGEYLLFVQDTKNHMPKWYEELLKYDSNANGHSNSMYIKWSISLLNSKLPIVGVSWINAVAYCDWLSKKTNKVYRLLTEAEWEFAAGGGACSRSKYAGAVDENSIDHFVWHEGNSDGIIHEVGLKRPNSLGIHDMCGNVWEWCKDAYSCNSYLNKQEDCESEFGKKHVYRGGSCLNTIKCTNVYYRNFDIRECCEDDIGFRIAMEP